MPELLPLLTYCFVFGVYYFQWPFSSLSLGSPLNAPENTLASFEQAKKEGVDLIEFDVGFTKDFVPVLMHDDDLDRTTNMTGPLNRYNFVELEKCNCAAKFRFFLI
uniref:GP-PDE domain-containing protein n=1 Tax=Meloidogyne javanica TaxID=6303 RepID=A0A915M3H0_MELJA